MRKAFFKISPAFFICVTFLIGPGVARAYDDMPVPPRLPPGWTPPPKATEELVTQEVERQTTERFVAAAGSANGPLSQQQAKRAGWGFVSDHFSEIDRSGNGYVHLSDVLQFMSQRKPQQIMRLKP